MVKTLRIMLEYRCYPVWLYGEPFCRETMDYVAALRAAGIRAQLDVYPTNVHAFDMLWPEDELSKKAIRRFNELFEEELRMIIG